MIPRYSCSEISEIWSDQSRFSLWFDIEMSVLSAQIELGHVPYIEVKKLPAGFIFDSQQISEIESVVKHDVIAFLSYVSGLLGIDSSYMHYGMTSSDLVDTCYSIQLVKSIDVVLDALEELTSALAIRAEQTRRLFAVGRSHGIHAEPIVFGLKFLRFYAEFKRSISRLRVARSEVGICKMSGVMGNYANIDPRVEEIVADKFGLLVETIASQVIPRDRYAFLFSVLGVLGSSIENMSVEIRGLQRSEVSEVSEGFMDGQKGSSAMPHKRNPILVENLTGISRMMRSFVVPAMENVVLWHERDISHSSVERCFSPDVFHLSSFALKRLLNVVQNLVIDEESVKKNLLSSKGLIFSQRVLLELVKSGLSRDCAYEIVQRNSFSVLSGESMSFFDALVSDADVTKQISMLGLESLFDFSYYAVASDLIYDRVLGSL